MSLFAGIGGFSLAARWAGWETPVMVENNPYCQEVLKKNFKHSIIHGDIREFDGSVWRGRIGCITGGFPCQPFSTAGRRLGAADDRFLWPEMFRVIREVGSPYIIAENVSGLLSMGGGDILRGILADLEGAGYWNFEERGGARRCVPLVLPAVGVGAPHWRDRVIIVAHLGEQRWEEGRAVGAEEAQWGERCGGEFAADGDGGGLEGGLEGGDGIYQSAEFAKRAWRERWEEVAACLCGVDDGFPSRVDGIGGVPAVAAKKRGKNAGRQWRIEALGNAVVPELIYEVFCAINEHVKQNCI